MRKILIVLSITLAILLSLYIVMHSRHISIRSEQKNIAAEKTDSAIHTPPLAVVNPPAAAVNHSVLTEPIDSAKSRVTKKPFGLYVTPKNSPVQPEKFAGFHTGVDFETTPDEQETNVPIKAICTGPLMVKRTATGYGGVVVQSCTLAGSPITVIYGHLTIASVAASVGNTLNAGNTIGVLGKGYSTETDGERKHLHLGIHRGVSVNIVGYVQNKADLTNWINVLEIL